MIVVLDTNILFAGLVSPRGASDRILDLVIEGDLTCAATPALWAEYEEQLASSRFNSLTPLSSEQIGDFLDYLASLVVPAQNDFVWRGILLDEDDAIVAESAFNANADVLITFNEVHFRTIKNQVSFLIQRPGEFLETWKEQQG